MVKKIDEILSESIGLSEEAKSQIVGLWENRISEAREEVAATLREEFARKFEHDKGVLVESMDRFLTDKIDVELREFAEDKRKLAEDRVVYKRKISEHTKILNKFITETVANEVKDLRTDRRRMDENFKKLENFLLKQLAEEIRDFRTDKKSLVEQKVKMVKEGREQINKVKSEFVKRAAKLVENTINNSLQKEISQFRTDIKTARENEFGRKMFEAFATEFMTSYLNEGTELKKLQRIVESKDSQISTLNSIVDKNKKLMEGLQSKVKSTQDLIERQGVMNELLAPLAKDKRAVMKELLESTQTKNLRGAFDKYLPSVLNESSNKVSSNSATKKLNESSLSVRTGDRAVVAQTEASDDATELQKILSLAGITK